MKKPLALLAIAACTVCTALVTEAATNAPSSLPCGALHMMCMKNRQARCIARHWRCVSSQSSSSKTSARSSTCRPLTLLCTRTTHPECRNGKRVCVQNSSLSSSSTRAALPHILSLSPASGAAGLHVTIAGNGFLAHGNTVTFADSVIPNLDSSDSTHLNFTVPGATTLPCFSAHPSCAHPMRLYAPGQYDVAVQTSDGRSNTLSFSIMTQSAMATSSQEQAQTSANSTADNTTVNATAPAGSCKCPAGQAWDPSKKTCVQGAITCNAAAPNPSGYCGCDGGAYPDMCAAARAGVRDGHACQG